MSIEDTHRLADQAKNSLELGIAGAKHLDTTCLEAESGLARVLHGINRLNTGELQMMAGIMSRFDAMDELISGAGFAAATQETATLANDSGNERALAAAFLAADADTKYNAASAEAVRVGTGLVEALGMLAAATARLEALLQETGAVRHSLHEIAGVWDNGPVSQVIGTFIGKQPIHGIAPTAVDALSAYQTDITGNGATEQ